MRFCRTNNNSAPWVISAIHLRHLINGLWMPCAMQSLMNR